MPRTGRPGQPEVRPVVILYPDIIGIIAELQDRLKAIEEELRDAWARDRNRKQKLAKEERSLSRYT